MMSAAAVGFGVVGMGIGAGLDAIFPHHRLLYTAARGAARVSFSVTPVTARTAKGLQATVAW